MAFHNANAGNLQSINDIYNKLYKHDDTLSGDTDVRVEALKSAEFILPEDLPKKQAEFFENFLIEFMPELINHALELKLKGNCFRQIIYKKTKLIEIDHFESYKNLDLRVVNKELVLFVEDKIKRLPELQFVRLWQDTSVYESIIKYYAFISFALNNWASFTETYGKPIRIGKYKVGSSKEEKAGLMEMVKNLGSDLSAVISDNTLIEFAEFKNTTASSNLYNDLLNFCKKAITKRILGQTLTTQTENVGSYAQAKVHDMVRQDILQADIRDAQHYISFICTRLNQLNFNNENIKVKLSLPTKIDLAERIAIDEKLNKIIEIPPEYFYETYNIQPPKEGMKKKEAAQQIPFQQTAEGRAADSITLETFNSPESLTTELPHEVTRLPHEVTRVPHVFWNQENQAKTIKALKAYRTKINNAKSYQELKELPYPTELYLATGSDIWENVLAEFVKIRKESNLKNIFTPRSELPIEYEFTTEDIEALNAFRAESFVVAGVSSETMRTMVKTQAEKAFTEGIGFHEFKENLKLNGFETDKPHFLRTNFNTAIANAQSAANWQNFDDQKNVFPYLQYITMEDDDVRDSHKILNNIVRHVDDDFWNEHYPPNGWNCRCYVEQITQSEALKSPGIKIPTPPNPNINREWKRNAGKNKTLFGDWLSCDDNKLKNNHQDDGPTFLMEFYNLKKHCPLLYAKNYKDLGLKDWKEIVKKAKDIAPELLKLKNQKEYEDYFEKNIVGEIKDAVNFSVEINKDFFKKQTSKGKRSQSRLERLNWIKPTLNNADEIWLQTDGKRHFYTYFKAFKGQVGGLSCVTLKNGRISTFFEPDNIPYINRNRKGFLIYKK